MSDIKEDWQDISDRKRAERQSRLPVQWIIPDHELPTTDVLDVTKLCQEKGWLSAEELDITSQTVVQLSKALSTSKLTALAVVSAFVHRATIAHQLLDPLTEINFEQAFSEAKRLDKHLEDTGQVVGPLHGIPISIKDQFTVKGLDTTMGYCAWEGQIAQEDWSVVAALRKAGAVILTKTNVGHTLMFTETINPLWGRTVNPFNRLLTTGASSGGEGALIGFHGSPLGFGTDIGGSIRVPAALCGLYSLRPSHARVSMRGVADPMEGQEAVRSTAGPMAHSPDDIGLVMKVYMLSEPWRYDPVVLNLPWNMAPYAAQKKFCFAVAYGDELATPHPPTIRGLKHITKVLRAAGHTVVEWQGSFRVETTVELMTQFWNAAGGESIKRDIEASGEPMYHDTKAMLTAKAISVFKMWAFQHQRTKHVEWWHDTWEATSQYSGTSQPIDGLISALCPYTAWPHRVDIGENVPAYEHPYCFEQPLLDLASGTFPTGLHQDPSIDLPDPDFKPRSKLDAEEYEKYGDPEKWRNGPIGLQITARRLEEEKVLAMVCKIRDALSE